MTHTEEDFIRALIDVDANVLDALLTTGQHDFHIDDMLKNEMPALHFAVIFRCIDMVKVLLKHGADVNRTNKEGETCLHFAVENALWDCDTLEIRKILTDIVIDSACKKKLTASFSTDSETIQTLQQLFEISLESLEFEHGPLYYDNFEGDISLVELLLRFGANPNIQSNSVLTPLLIYCRRRDKDTRILDLLLEFGADVKIKDKYGMPAIEAAIETGTVEMVKKLLDAGSDMNDLSYNHSPLNIVSDNADDVEIVSIMQLLTEKGANVNFKNRFYETALQAAVHAKSLAGVKCLLSLGADPNLYNKRGFSELSTDPPLWYAVYYAEPEIAEYLINHGADVFYKDLYRTTLLSAAMDDDIYADEGKLSSTYADKALNCVTLLMESGVAMNKRDRRELSSNKFRILENCQRELELLKKTRIHPDFRTTYFDFLLKRDQTLVLYLRNEKIAAAMKSEDYKYKFVNFSNRLATNHARGLKLSAMTDRLRSVLSDIFKTVFPLELIYTISDFFNEEDLKKCLINE